MSCAFIKHLFPVLALAGLLGACASVPPPHAPLARAEVAVEQAQAVAGSGPAGSALRAARETLEKAQAQVREGENLAARRNAEVAVLQARNAQALAAAKRAELAVAKARGELDRLRQEIRRIRDGPR